MRGIDIKYGAITFIYPTNQNYYNTTFNTCPLLPIICPKFKLAS